VLHRVRFDWNVGSPLHHYYVQAVLMPVLEARRVEVKGWKRNGNALEMVERGVGEEEEEEKGESQSGRRYLVGSAVLTLILARAQTSRSESSRHARPSPSRLPTHPHPASLHPMSRSHSPLQSPQPLKPDASPSAVPPCESFVRP
jgi:hypothetical protein